MNYNLYCGNIEAISMFMVPNLGIPEEELLRQQQELFAKIWLGFLPVILKDFNEEFNFDLIIVFYPENCIFFMKLCEHIMSGYEISTIKAKKGAN
ncbi:hypothetical protein Avbf_10181 [Armadillidium vulgare]|nr:hypothetical protein Avbf_10181 [Armadillidium vulgare]